MPALREIDWLPWNRSHEVIIWFLVTLVALLVTHNLTRKAEQKF